MSTEWVTKKIDKFVIVNKKLGKGAFGTVFRGFFEQDESRLIAAKQISLSNIEGQDMQIKFIKREINNLQKLDSKYIVKLYDVSRTPNNLYMFLEYCMDGDLKEYLKKKKNRQLSEPEAIKFFKHIVEGFKEMQKHSMIHRDIKPENIMLSQGRAKISDFGFSRHLESDSKQNLTRLGSPLYMSPQILEGSKFSSKCDVWSVGIVFYEMLYGKTPWTGLSQIELFKNIKEQELSFPDEPIRSEPVKELLQKMLQYREEDRVSWQQIFSDDLIANKNPLEESAQLLSLTESELDKSMIENGAYMQTNLVVNYLKNIEEDMQEGDGDDKTPKNLKTLIPRKQSSDEDSNSTPTTMTPKATEEKYQFEEKAEQVMRAQLNSEKVHKSVMKVNEYILYERNVSFFYNYVIQKVIKLFNAGVLSASVSNELYYRTIFSICKCQNVNLEKMNSMLKSPENNFKETWQEYRASKEYMKTQKTISIDIMHSKKFCGELIKKTTEVVDAAMRFEKKEAKKEFLKKFLEIVNDRCVQDPSFNQMYQATLSEFLDAMKQLVSVSSRKDLLVVTRYIVVCQSPYKELNNTDFDFNKFYEEIDNMSLDKLRAEVNKKIEPS